MNESVLISIKIPENLKMINGRNIENRDINEFIIPSSITKLGEYCFCAYYSLQSINIPTSKNRRTLFLLCESLTSINIPTSVSKIGYECFYGCSSLEQLIYQQV
ncbi:LOW QUALITY PROTEIN: hypothetical protein ENUP19_0198G0001 [Entamoeba nuttalli]|uniref:Leucine rich repeat protein, BspA family protein n=1 Tax=Entamoeba nuttalli TaxID=412467 RepID=A0ABQ0DNE3_9EUKA